MEARTMGLRIEITWGLSPLDPAYVERLDSLTQLVQERTDAMSQQLDDLKREVQESRAVTEGAVTLIGGLSDQIRELKDDPQALEDLAAELDSQQQALAAAITANTPSTPTPPVE
jgi:chromosome segregation ATPase